MARLLIIPMLAMAICAIGCETRETYRSDRGGRRAMTSDPFGGASLMTGTDFRSADSNTPGHNDGYFKTPRRR